MEDEGFHYQQHDDDHDDNDYPNDHNNNNIKNNYEQQSSQQTQQEIQHLWQAIAEMKNEISTLRASFKNGINNEDSVKKRKIGSIPERISDSKSTSTTLPSSSKKAKTPPKRSTFFNDKNLQPGGKFANRLNRELTHFPVPAQHDKIRCAMHRWGGQSKAGQVMYCEDCYVHLCIDCYKPFHTIQNLVSEKQSYITKFANKKKVTKKKLKKTTTL